MNCIALILILIKLLIFLVFSQLVFFMHRREMAYRIYFAWDNADLQWTWGSLIKNYYERYLYGFQQRLLLICDEYKMHKFN